MHRVGLVLILGCGACNEELLPPRGGAGPIDPVEPGPRLSFGRMPVNGKTGAIMEPVEVVVRLPSGAVNRNFSQVITISAHRQWRPVPLRGTVEVQARAGVAAFTDLAIDNFGFGYQLTASAVGLESVASDSFAIGISCPASGCATPLLAFADCLEWGWDASFWEVCLSSGLWILDAGGSERLIATSWFGFDDPAWSPDGLRIVFTGYDHCDPVKLAGCSGDLYVMDADGSNLQRYPTAATNGGTNVGASWSPDGRRLVFESYHSFTSTQALYVINADGSGLARLGDLEGGQPAWSPDGTRVAFVRQDGSGRWRILTATPDGQDVVQLTAAESSSGVGVDDFRPAWSPDGHRVAFTRTWRFPDGHGSCQVMVTDADGSNVVQLTRDDFCSRSPAWSPDGAVIAFNGALPGSQRLGIMLMNADGSGAGLVRAMSSDFARVTWYPGR